MAVPFWTSMVSYNVEADQTSHGRSTSSQPTPCSRARQHQLLRAAVGREMDLLKIDLSDHAAQGPSMTAVRTQLERMIAQEKTTRLTPNTEDQIALNEEIRAWVTAAGEEAEALANDPAIVVKNIQLFATFQQHCAQQPRWHNLPHRARSSQSDHQRNAPRPSD